MGVVQRNAVEGRPVSHLRPFPPDYVTFGLGQNQTNTIQNSDKQNGTSKRDPEMWPGILRLQGRLSMLRLHSQQCPKGAAWALHKCSSEGLPGGFSKAPLGGSPGTSSKYPREAAGGQFCISYVSRGTSQGCQGELQLKFRREVAGGQFLY